MPGINDGYTFEGTDKKGNAFKFENLKLCYLDSGNEVEVIKAPPMSEELVYLNGKIYILCESASNKYIFGRLLRGIICTHILTKIDRKSVLNKK